MVVGSGWKGVWQGVRGGGREWVEGVWQGVRGGGREQGVKGGGKW